MLLHQFQPMRRVGHAIMLREHDRSAGRQHPEDVPDRQIERQARDAEHSIAGSQVEALVDVVDRVRCRPVRDDDALRFAGGTGGVDDICGGVRIDGDIGHGVDALQQVHGDRTYGRGDLAGVAQPGLGERHLDAGAVDDPFPAGCRLGDRDRHVGRADRRDRQGGDDLFRSFLHEDGHTVAGANAGFSKSGGCRADTASQLGEADHIVAVEDRRGVRIGVGPIQNPLVQHTRRDIGRGVVVEVSATALFGRQGDRILLGPCVG